MHGVVNLRHQINVTLGDGVQTSIIDAKLPFLGTRMTGLAQGFMECRAFHQRKQFTELISEFSVNNFLLAVNFVTSTIYKCDRVTVVIF